MGKWILYEQKEYVIPDDAYVCPVCGNEAKTTKSLETFVECRGIDNKLPTFRCKNCKCIWVYDPDISGDTKSKIFVDKKFIDKNE